MNDLVDYIAEAPGSSAIAIAYSRRIQVRCEKIGLVPFGGARRDDLSPGLRIIPLEKSALVCYRIMEDAVWITNIFRAGRDFEAILRGDPQSGEDE
ncbi:MAG: type II toxin-antitoxin system RelE/ParE family toxin [Mesorhizobium sp.]|nr:type II toxin-antitoxin system RelE/ParE family toxin [Mesorhizobium sp.]